MGITETLTPYYWNFRKVIDIIPVLIYPNFRKVLRQQSSVDLLNNGMGDSNRPRGKRKMPSKKHELKKELIEKIQEQIEDYFEEMRPIMERIAAEAAEKVFKEKFSQFQNIQIDSSSEFRASPSNPPLPETIRGSRKHKVPRQKLSGTVDAALLKLFEDERRERGFNISRMLDVVLWSYFSLTRPEKTKLSFESSDGQHDTE